MDRKRFREIARVHRTPNDKGNEIALKVVTWDNGQMHVIVGQYEGRVVKWQHSIPVMGGSDAVTAANTVSTLATLVSVLMETRVEPTVLAKELPGPFASRFADDVSA